jgi:hypothetical protein
VKKKTWCAPYVYTTSCAARLNFEKRAHQNSLENARVSSHVSLSASRQSGGPETEDRKTPLAGGIAENAGRTVVRAGTPFLHTMTGPV